MSNRYLWWALLISMLAYFWIESAYPDTIRIYKQDNGISIYKGRADRQVNGSWRIYDNKGKFQGRCDRDRCVNRDGKIEPLFRRYQ